MVLAPWQVLVETPAESSHGWQAHHERDPGQWRCRGRLLETGQGWRRWLEAKLSSGYCQTPTAAGLAGQGRVRRHWIQGGCA